jgi:hypothetical protein
MVIYMAYANGAWFLELLMLVYMYVSGPYGLVQHIEAHV